MLFDKQFSENNLVNALTKDFKDQEGNSLNLSPAQRCISLIRTASLVRVATMEGAAFFGLVTTMTVATSGVGNIENAYYLNASSILPLLAYIAMRFPNAERIEDIFKVKIQKIM